MIRVVHPGSRIRMLTFYPSRIQDPGSRGQKGTGSRIRIRNIALNMQNFLENCVAVVKRLEDKEDLLACFSSNVLVLSSTVLLFYFSPRLLLSTSFCSRSFRHKYPPPCIYPYICNYVYSYIHIQHHLYNNTYSEAEKRHTMYIVHIPPLRRCGWTGDATITNCVMNTKI
jgi:hypothetical protein